MLSAVRCNPKRSKFILGNKPTFLKTDGLYQVLIKKKKKENPLVSVVVVKN